MKRPLLIGAALAAGALAVTILANSPPGAVAPVAQVRAGGTAGAAPAGPARPPSDTELRTWIVGGWAQAGAAWGGDGADVYGAGGRYAGPAQRGRWRIEAGKLILTITHEMRTDMLMPQPFEPVPEPRPTIFSLTREGPDRMRIDANGAQMGLTRCPGARA